MPSEWHCADGPPGAGEHTDPVGQFVLAAIGGPEQFERVEQRRRPDITTRGHERRGGIDRLFDDIGHPIAVVDGDDPRLRRYLSIDGLDSEERVRIGPLAFVLV